jgi:hypothetical protein
MANKKISQLTVAAPLTGTEVLPIVQGGVTVQATAQNIADLAGGLEGTQYVFVAANGTDVENAAELQAAYDKAIIMAAPVPTLGIATEVCSYSTTYIEFKRPPGELPIVTGETTLIINGISYPVTITNVFYVNFSSSCGFAAAIRIFGVFPNIEVANGTLINTFYLVPKTARIIAAPGNYDFGISTFQMNTPFISLISLDGNRSIVFNSTLDTSNRTQGSINITANNVFVKGVDVLTKNFTISSSLNSLVVENCKGGDFSFGGDPLLGLSPINLSGKYKDCEGGNQSFGSYGTASGTFTNCIGGNQSFGSYGTAQGFFTNCEGGNQSFGSYGTAPGIFNNCTGQICTYGLASGTFTNCNGGSQSFGSYGTASGIFNNCLAFNDGFGVGGTLSGRLNYCRLTLGVFPTVSSGGRTYYCIDGQGNTNNQ